MICILKSDPSSDINFIPDSVKSYEKSNDADSNVKLFSYFTVKNKSINCCIHLRAVFIGTLILLRYNLHTIT